MSAILFSTKLGLAIQQLRKQQKMTIEEFSKKSDLCISRLSQIENGATDFRLKDLDKIAKALSISGLAIVKIAENFE